MTDSHFGLRPEGRSRGDDAGSVRLVFSRVKESSDANGRRPVTISCITMPSA